MVEEKGLEPAIADKIGSYVKHKGTTELLETLMKDSALVGNKRAKEGLEDIKLLLTYLKAFGILHRVPFSSFLSSATPFLRSSLFLFFLSLSSGFL